MIPKAYRAAVLTAPGTIEIQERPTPTLSAGEALVRVRYAGICGTDLALFSGDYPTPLPLVPGHEFSGEVAAVGEGADPELVGRPVTGEINITCRSRGAGHLCPACSRGIPSHCRTRSVLGIVGRDGAFAEYLVLPACNLHMLPATLPLRHGAFVEPLAAVIQTFELTDLAPGDTVVVMGAGRLGVLICKVAALKGAQVAAVSRSPYKLQLARKFGARVILEPDGGLRERVLAMTDGLGADVVVECTGDPKGIESAMGLVRPRGTVCLKSTPGDQTPPFPLTSAVVDEIRVQGSRCGPFGKAIRLMLRHGLPMEELISAEYELEEIQAAIEAACTKFRVLVRCS